MGHRGWSVHGLARARSRARSQRHKAKEHPQHKHQVPTISTTLQRTQVGTRVARLMHTLRLSRMSRPKLAMPGNDGMTALRAQCGAYLTVPDYGSIVLAMAVGPAACSNWLERVLSFREAAGHAESTK